MRVFVSLALLAGCSKKEDPEQQALDGVKAYVDDNLADLAAAAQGIQDAAPAPDADGSSATADAASIDKMKDEWKKARTAYEHIEGAIAVLFPDLDVSTDARYDDFLGLYGEDDDLFDDQDVTGVHAIERILWSDQIPADVVAFEAGIPGYEPAAFPSTQAEADEFRNQLCRRLVDDVATMSDDFEPLALDPAAAYRGVIGSMQEQTEKIQKATSGEEESRYAQYTLADMRANVDAGVATFASFEPWLESVGGHDQIQPIHDQFDAVKAAYAQIQGDALPAVPDGWSNDDPSQEDLATPFGQLWSVLAAQSDGQKDGSLVSLLNASAATMDIPELPQ